MSPPEENSDVKKSERKYQVFISSTFEDLAEQRRIVLDEVVVRGHMPIALERFPAEDSSVPFVIQRTIQASQIYVIILGYRYGAIVKGRDISFSQLEYEIALNADKVIVPFLLVDSEVHKHRDALRRQLEEERIQVARYASGTPDRRKAEKAIAYLETELGNEEKLWGFRTAVQEGRFFKLFSLERGGNESSGLIDQFGKHLVLEALLVAEETAWKRRIPGWIREPEETELAETLVAISRNRFLVDVVGAMAKFDPLDPRIRDQADEKEVAAAFFVDKYLSPLLESDTTLFFESGSTVAFVAQFVGDFLREQRKELRIITNNVLAYLILWLVHRIRCSLFPWGPPEQRYGAVFGAVNDHVPEIKRPSFPPEPLNHGDLVAIDLLENDQYGPKDWGRPALLLGALSGLQLTKDPNIANCLGPHVGSPRNKVFKRFMYETKLPLMLFMAAHKIDSPVDTNRCHFILDQKSDQDLPWEVFYKERPVAFCVGCKNEPHEIEQLVFRFEELGFKIMRTGHRTPYTAFIARNQKFIDELESGMNIR